MTLQTINLGTTANDGTGDDLRTAFQKVNENFTILNATSITSVENIGDGYGLYSGGRTQVLALKTLTEGNNIILTTNSETITISANDSINSLLEDLNPALGSDLYTMGHSIKASGTDLSISAYDDQTYNYNKVYINSLIVDGNNINGTGVTSIKTRPLDSLLISSHVDLTFHANGSIIFDGNVLTSNNITANSFYGDFNGLHIGPVSGSVTGNLTGNTYGIHTGNVVGNVSGMVGDISNHSIRELSDVSETLPTVGQILKWNGDNYEPSFVVDVLIDNGNKVITNVLDPINDTDAVNKQYYQNASNLVTGTIPKNILPDLQLTDLSDVNITSSPRIGSVLVYDGIAWDTNIDINFNKKLIKQPILVNYGEKINTPDIVNNELIIDIALGNTVKVILNDNITNISIINSDTVLSDTLYEITLIVIQNSSVAKTITWPSSFKWNESTPLQISTVLGAVDIFNLISYDSILSWICFQSGKNIG